MQRLQGKSPREFKRYLIFQAPMQVGLAADRATLQDPPPSTSESEAMFLLIDRVDEGTAALQSAVNERTNLVPSSAEGDARNVSPSQLSTISLSLDILWRANADKKGELDDAATDLSETSVARISALLHKRDVDDVLAPRTVESKHLK